MRDRKRRPVLLRFPVYFAFTFAVGVLHMQPWHWNIYPLSDVLIGLAVHAVVAAITAVGIWAGVNLGWKLRTDPDWVFPK